jgi:YbbR domain-containing protein
MDISGAARTQTKRIPINVYNDKGIELNLELNPSIAEITVPIYPIKEVGVDIPITGEVMEGYEIKEIRIEPNTVLIAGKEDILSNIDTVRCEPISVEEADANIYLPAEFIQGNYYIIENVNPRIEVEIEKIISKDLIYNIEDIEYKNIPEGLKVEEVEVESDFILVTIEGISSVVNQVSKEDILLTADLTEGVEGSNIVEFQIDTNIELNSFEISPLEGNATLTIDTETEETDGNQNDQDNENPEQIEDEVVQ